MALSEESKIHDPCWSLRDCSGTARMWLSENGIRVLKEKLTTHEKYRYYHDKPNEVEKILAKTEQIIAASMMIENDLDILVFMWEILEGSLEWFYHEKAYGDYVLAAIAYRAFNNKPKNPNPQPGESRFFDRLQEIKNN